MYESIQLTKTTSFSSTLPGRSPRQRCRILCSLAAAPTLVFLLLAAATAFAGSATWNLIPTSNDWNTSNNWTPATVPKEPNDTATFDLSNQTDPTIIQDDIYNINGIVFNSGASPFTITVQSSSSFAQPLTLSGAGITNNSGIAQNFVTNWPSDFDAPGLIEFTNNATAGDLTVFTNQGGSTVFFDTSSAGSGTFVSSGKTNDFEYGTTKFVDDATASNATLSANGSGVNGAFGGLTVFQDTSTAGGATLIANGGSGGGLGGIISFQDDSTGGATRVKVFGNGSLDISTHNAPGVTVGSIGGDGMVTLGGNNLTVGSNDLTTTFSGVMDDSGAGGSFTKTGTGGLILTNANTYSGGTTISGGYLSVRNRKGSATGSGAVQVDAGRLGGRGIIAGPVTIGTGSGALADLSPGRKGVEPGTLRCLSTLTFNSHGIYSFELNSDNAIADRVTANGVTIRSHSHFFVTDLGHDLWSSAELYDSTDGTWSGTGSLATARAYQTETLLPSGKVLVAGGQGNAGYLASAELYNPGTGSWAATGSLADVRAHHTATLLPSGKVLVAGGNYPGTSAELYDPATGTWSTTGSMTTGRDIHTATLLPNGKVLVAGGYDIASAELYDPATGIWTTTGSLATARGHHTATLLPSGKVLVAGGRSNFLQLASAELYDPATGTWSAAKRLATARDSHTATLLPDGEVLVAGGFGGNASAELYNPATGTWSATGSLTTARGGQTATLLPNGEVLAAAGFSVAYPYPPLASVELYVPASETWTTVSSLSHARDGHTATLLPNGDVLVAGGFGAGILPIGTVFTAIDNTSATPISGTFLNLFDGSTITVGENTYQVSYSGGDGNDLTLTVQ